jgi:tetratricopeptide (TPR) repeat protein
LIKNLTLVFFLCFLSTGTFAESAREYFKFAKFSYDSKEYSKALDFINRAIEVDPNYINGFLLRAEINFGLQEFNEVIKDITFAFNLDENASKTMAKFHLLRGDAHLKLNNLNKALSDIDFSIRLNSKIAKAFFLKGIVNTEKAIYFEAVENFDQAITLDPDVSDYYYKRAELKKLYYRPIAGTKTYESIMADIKITIALDPDDCRPYILKCTMLKLDANLEKGKFISELDGFIEHFPERAYFYAERGMANVLNFNYGSALGDFTKAIHLDEFNESNYRNRGLCFHNMRKYQLALNDYSKSINVLITKYQASKNDESLKKLLAQTFNMRGMTNQLNGNSDLACDDYYNAAKLGSKVGLNNYRRNCNVYN